jgi:hypothetical protein
MIRSAHRLSSAECPRELPTPSQGVLYLPVIPIQYFYRAFSQRTSEACPDTDRTSARGDEYTMGIPREILHPAEERRLQDDVF